ncbi:hypothetical protein ACFE04_018829 [Oxalis oulophora]
MHGYHPQSSFPGGPPGVQDHDMMGHAHGYAVKDKTPNRNPNLKPQSQIKRSPILPPSPIASQQQQQQQPETPKHVIANMHHHNYNNHSQSLSSTSSTSSISDHDSLTTTTTTTTLDPPAPDYTLSLTDELLLNILSRSQHVSNSLVCKRWLCLNGKLVKSLKVTDFSLIESGRLFFRFPNLTDVDIVRSCVRTVKNSGVFLSNKNLSVHVGAGFCANGFIDGNELLPCGLVNKYLKLLAQKYPNLRRIVAIRASEDGLMSVAQECETLQELELHCCGDMSLQGISGCRNLQMVKLIGCVDGFYSSVVSDIGLTLLAQGCRRLMKLELKGCEGSYDGIKAIGQCCQMLEELTIADHRMDGGWLAALTFCENLKILGLRSCKCIDSSPGLDEHLGSCFTLEELHLHQCQLRDKQSVKALLMVCQTVKEIILQDCWGMSDEVFSLASVCRRVNLLSLEGCSLLTTGGLESVIIFWTELQSLRVISCNNIKDSEITPALASLFSDLKELKWGPDSRSILSASLSGTGVGNKGTRFFKGLKA